MQFIRRKKQAILTRYKKRKLSQSDYQDLLGELSEISDSESDSDNYSELEIENEIDSDEDDRPIEHDNTEASCSHDDKTWNKNNDMPEIQPFIGESGIKVNIPETPLQFLQLFITRELLEHFRKHTNLYAEKRKENSAKMYKKWYKASIMDIAKYIGLTVLFGILKLPRLSMHWARGKAHSTPAVPDCMSYSRYKQLGGFFHSNANATSTDRPSQDRLMKIRPVIDYLIPLFKSTYTPKKNLSIDEGMLPYKGRLNFKCYLPKKPIKYGIKLYILAEADTGYVSNFIVYSGVGNTTCETVYDLMKDLKEKNYHLYMDNYYNSVELSEKLLKDKIYTCGTMRIVRGAPKFFQTSLKKLKKGNLTFCRKGGTFIIVWKDKRLVSMITTNNNASTEPVTRHIKAKKNGKTVHLTETVNKPKAIIDYNKNMKGVDFYDQMIKYYSFARKSSRWSKKATLYLLQMAIHNAYVLYKQYTKDEKVMDFLSFHTMTYTALMNFELDEWPFSGNEVDPNDPCDKESTNPQMDIGILNENVNECEDDNVSHSDIFISKNKIIVSDPLIRLDTKKLHVLDPIEDKKRRICRVCSKIKKPKQTRYECKTCNIPLCIGECYSYYHTYKHYASRISKKGH